MSDFDSEALRYQIFQRDGVYEVTCMNYFERTEEYKGIPFGHYMHDEEKARKVAYILNHIKDPMACVYFIDLVGLK